MANLNLLIDIYDKIRANLIKYSYLQFLDKISKKKTKK